MTAMFGAFDSTKAVARSLVERMLEDSYCNKTTVTTAETSTTLFAVTDPEDRAFIFRSDTTQLVLFGTVFLPSGKRLSSEKLYHDEFLPAFISDKKTFLSKCRGTFCLGFYDIENETVTLATDPFGNLPLFYTITPSGLLFSTRQRPIAIATAAPLSRSGILQYIRAGLLLGNGSFYENIHRLQVASLLTYTAKNNTIEQYFQPSYDYANNEDVVPILEKIKDSLLSSVAGEIDETTGSCIALSGGFDSRATLAVISAAKKTSSTFFYTHGPQDSYDMIIAAEIAKTFGINHKQFTLSQEVFARATGLFETVVANSEGGMGIEAAISLLIWQWQREHCTTMYDSHGGQIFRRTIFKARHSAIEKEKNIAEGILKYTSTGLFQSSFLLPAIKSEAQKLSLRAATDYFHSLPGTISTGDKIDRYFIDQLCKNKYSHVGNVQMNYLKFVHPLLTPQTSELLSKLPEEFRRKNGVYLNMLHSFAPQLTRIAVENNGYRIPFKGYRWKRYIPQGIDRALRMVGAKPLFQRPITSIDFTLKLGKAKAAALVLENIEYLTEYIDVAAVEKSIQMDQVGNTELTALTNFSLSMKYLAGK